VGKPLLSFKEALLTLAQHDVAFIVVGGVAAVLSGAPISTFDLDIVQERSAENISRLLVALNHLDARYRDPAGRVIRPEASPLEGEGHHLLMTRCGPLDVLGKIARRYRYEDLVGESELRPVGTERVLVLGLAAQIRIKTEVGREKDRAVLSMLRRTLEESKPEK
jgi:hypothetical protein